MRTIVMNTNNIVPDGQNNKLVYKFPNSVQFKGNSIAVSSVSMYYSWFNIASIYTNNTFTINWVLPTGVNTLYTVTIPDGLYEISELNSFLQYFFIQSGMYFIDSTGKNVYYAEFILNPTRYAVQINTYQFPTALPVGYTVPANFIGYPPVSTFNPVVTIPAKLNEVFGYVAGFATNINTANAYVPPVSPFVSKNGAGTLSYLSTTSPNVQPNSCIYFSISNINNQYAQPSSIIYALVPQGAVGTLITERPPNFAWNQLIDGTYNELRLTFLGADLQPIKLNDPSMTILLIIKDASEPITK